MNVKDRLKKLEITGRQNAMKYAAVNTYPKRPKITREEWIEIQQKTGFRTSEYPKLLREILGRNNDERAVKFATYLDKLDVQYASEEVA